MSTTISQQLAERKARFQQQQQALEMQSQLQSQPTAEQLVARPEPEPQLQISDSTSPATYTIDRDHEIALLLQRQFDQENVEPRQPIPAQQNFGPNPNVPIFNSNDFAQFHGFHLSPTFQQQPQQQQHQFHVAFNGGIGSHESSHFSFTSSSTGPDGRVNHTVHQSSGQLPFPFQSMMAPSIDAAPFMGMPHSMHPGIGGLLASLPILRTTPQVATQQDIDGNTVTDVFHSKQQAANTPSSTEEANNGLHGNSESDPSQTCCICYEPFKEGDAIRRLPCLHVFHKAEIDKWLATGSDKCPICRASILQHES